MANQGDPERATKIHESINSLSQFIKNLNDAEKGIGSSTMKTVFPITSTGAVNIDTNNNRWLNFTAFMNNILVSLKSISELQIELSELQVEQDRLISIQNNTSKSLVQNESDQVDARIKQLQQDKVSSVRMLEINNYFTERTKAYNQLIRIVCGLIILIIILSILIKKQIIPSNISNFVLFVVILISVIIILSKLFDIFRRDNMDFNDFRFIDNVKANDPTVIEYNARQLGLIDADATLDFNTCIGSSCCSEPGLVYDDAIDKCVAES